MLLRRFTDFVLRGRLQAMASAFLIAFIPVLGMVSILIAGLVTLRKGAYEGALVLLAATLPYLLGFLVSGTAISEQEPLTQIIIWVFVVSNVLTWFFAIVLRKFNNWSFTLELAALLGVLIIGIVHIIYPDIQQWWAVQLNAYFAKTAEVVGKIKGEAAVAGLERQAQAVAAAKYFATGLIAVSILFNVLLQLLIARWWQAAMFNPGGLRKELLQIRLGHVTALVFAVEIILSYTGNDFALDTLPVLYGAFFAAGLSLIHYLAQLAKNALLWLVLFYGVVVWLFPLSIILVGILGLIDTGFDFRKRFLEKR